MGNNELLTFRKMGSGHLKCSLDLSELYPSKVHREKFDSKWEDFLKSDPSNKRVFELNNNHLIYTSEQLIPTKKNNRPPLLLVFGNPASHSVYEGMFFSPNKAEKENRFWKHLLPRAGILDFSFDENLSLKELNKLKKKCMVDLDYKSPFRIGLCVYYSMPSSAGGPWSGVAGLRKLLGKSAMEEVEKLEKARIQNIASNFLTNKGIVVTFQKDAWEGLRSDKDPKYSIDKARKGKLQGTLRFKPHVPLIGVPPTRLLGPSSTVLHQLLSSRG